MKVEAPILRLEGERLQDGVTREEQKAWRGAHERLLGTEQRRRRLDIDFARRERVQQELEVLAEGERAQPEARRLLGQRGVREQSQQLSFVIFSIILVIAVRGVLRWIEQKINDSDRGKK